MINKVVIDSKAPKEIRDTLKDLGFEAIILPPSPSLPAATSSHPDMLLFFGDKCFFCTEEYSRIAEKELSLIESSGYRRITVSEKLGEKYPHDVLLNALLLGGKLYCKEDAVSREIVKYAKEKEIAIRHIKQGYAKCSVCPVGDEGAITSDPSLANALSRDGIDVLRISAGGILLPPYDTGFIGGCSGARGDTIYFSGNIELHPDCERIKNFCLDHKMNIFSLSVHQLFDIGTLFFI
ncbi:MAG: hypothetical protein E7641_01330 [Ruminococcaceae bacterium]|nr:hypothetical protein [Oscillospiraceae bacterium]